MNKRLLASKQSIFRRAIWVALMTPLIVLIGGYLVSRFSDRQRTDEWLRDRTAVTDCYAKLRDTAEFARIKTMPSEHACRQMKEDYMRKWKRYKF